MSLAVAVQMDPIEQINFAGDSTFALMLEAAGPRPSALPLHTGQIDLGRSRHHRRGRGNHGRETGPAIILACKSRAARTRRGRCRAAAARSAVRSRLYHLDPSARAVAVARAGRQRSGLRPQRAGKAVRDGISAIHAGNVDHAAKRRRSTPFSNNTARS